ncbi:MULTISPECIES: hypothetical protein [Streptomyces]|uniref:Integral membrane protein n=1 Tax=Streptomyces nigrescens TaxID=1920 RepID=A0ABN6R322_STRNI|nr:MULTISPECIES: hypothetical protein [Streptomyces]BDM72819.1 hypothetical protein HEK616_63060 [Streptomyces nigrescens]
MKPITGDLAYELLARGSHHSHHYHHTGTYGGGGDGVLDWWEWLILAIGVIVVIWAVVKKFSSD